MSFTKKTWTDRISEFITRRLLTKADGSTEQVTVSRDEGEITQEGTPLNAESFNDLEGRIESAFSDTDDAISQLNTHLTELFPIGSIIQSTTLDTEAKVIAIYGGKTWSKIEGRFLLGQSSSYAINSTGGEATHELTVAEMPAHGHPVSIYHVNAGTTDYYKTYASDGTSTLTNQSGVGLNGSYIYGWSNAYKSAGNGWGDHGGNAISIGGNNTHNNMPPYKAIYIWERIA